MTDTMEVARKRKAKTYADQTREQPPGQDYPSIWQMPKSAFAVACALLLFLAIFGVPSGFGSPAAWITRGCATIFLLIVLRQRFDWTVRRPLVDSHRPTSVTALPPEQLYYLLRSVSGKGERALEASNVTQALLFTTSTLDPATVRQRITERYEPRHRSLIQAVTIEAQLPTAHLRRLVGAARQGGTNDATRPQAQPNGHGAGPHQVVEPQPFEASGHDSPFGSRSVIPFALLIPTKGELVDDLHVTSSDGSMTGSP